MDSIKRHRTNGTGCIFLQRQVTGSDPPTGSPESADMLSFTPPPRTFFNTQTPFIFMAVFGFGLCSGADTAPAYPATLPACTRLSRSPQSLIERLQSLIERLRSLIERLRSLIEGLRSPIERLQSLIEGLQSLIEGLQSLIEGLQSLIEGLQSLIDRLRSLIEGLQSLIERLRFLIAALRFPAAVLRFLIAVPRWFIFNILRYKAAYVALSHVQTLSISIYFKMEKKNGNPQSL
jgi:prefoldin subunit 5